MYCSTEDIQKQITCATLIQLTDDNNLNVVDETITFEAILYSSVLIDGYLRSRYELPLNAHLPLLRILAIDLSIYRLYSRRMQADLPDSIQKKYDEAIKTLEKIQKGIIALDVESGEEETTQTLFNREYRVNKTQADRIFNKKVIFDEY